MNRHDVAAIIVLLFCLTTSLGAEDGAALKFSNQTEASKIVNVWWSGPFFRYMAGGAVGDFNDDGFQDVFIPGSDSLDRLFINNRDGTFTDRAEEWGLTESHVGIGVAIGDFNDDGWLDIYETSMGPRFNQRKGQHKLWRNEGGSRFRNVATRAGVQATRAADGWGATFADCDLDGDLDLFVCGRLGAHLFRSNGDETFTDVTVESGLISDATRLTSLHENGMSANIIDMDGDRYPEILLVADRKLSRYFKNNGDGTFSDLTEESGTGFDEQGMGQAVGDFTGDGLPDWYVTSIHDEEYSGNKFYVNQGDHTFFENANAAGVHDGGFGWGAIAVDFDHDGLLDLAETNGSHDDETAEEQSYLWLNDGDSTFTEQALALGFEHHALGRSMVNMDYDNDGDQDVLIFNNGSNITLLRNDLGGTGANWLRVFLETRQDPALAPNGFGSAVAVVVDGKTQVRWIHSPESYLGKSEMSAHFGLGTSTTIDELRITWANGHITVLRDVGVNQTLSVSAPSPAVAGKQKPGDCNQDGSLDISDPICLLAHLFLIVGEPLPCGVDDGGDAQASRELIDVNGDGRVNLADAVAMLAFLFRGAPQSLSFGDGCEEILGCPDNSKACQP